MDEKLDFTCLAVSARWPPLLMKVRRPDYDVDKQIGNAEQILDACEGLTLAQVLERVKGPTLTVQCTSPCENIGGEACDEISSPASSPSSEKVVRLDLIHPVLVEWFNRYPDDLGLAGLMDRLRALAMPASPAPTLTLREVRDRLNKSIEKAGCTNEMGEKFAYVAAEVCFVIDDVTAALGEAEK